MTVMVGSRTGDFLLISVLEITSLKVKIWLILVFEMIEVWFGLSIRIDRTKTKA